MIVEFDPIDVLWKRAGDNFHPHKSVLDAPWMADYGCRRCWRVMEAHTRQVEGPVSVTSEVLPVMVCELGPNAIAVHQSCCPLCTKEI